MVSAGPPLVYVDCGDFLHYAASADFEVDGITYRRSLVTHEARPMIELNPAFGALTRMTFDRPPSGAELDRYVKCNILPTYPPYPRKQVTPHGITAS